MKMIRKIWLQDFNPSLPWSTSRCSKAPLTPGWAAASPWQEGVTGCRLLPFGGHSQADPCFHPLPGRAQPVSVPSSEWFWFEGFFPFNSVWHKLLRCSLPALRAPLRQVGAAVPRPHGGFSAGFRCSTALRPALLFPADPPRLEEY